MEATIVSLLPSLGPGALALIVVIYIYLKITNQRKETKVERDKDSQEIHDAILKHDFEISNIKGELTHQRDINEDVTKQISLLSESVAKFSVAVDNLVKTVDELKDEVKAMRR